MPRYSQNNQNCWQMLFKWMRDQLGISFSHVANELGVSVAMLSEITGMQPGDESDLSNVVPVSFQ